MKLLVRVVGLGLLVFGIYALGQNIIFTTNVGPYFWRGIAADASVLALMAGVLMLILLPRRSKSMGWVPIIAGIVLVFLSSRAILNPTSLWQFLVSFASMAGGYQLFTTGRIPL